MTDKELAKTLVFLEKFNIKNFNQVKEINAACALLNRQLEVGSPSKTETNLAWIKPHPTFRVLDNGSV